VSIDIEWARDQMKAADLLQPTQAAVEKLLSTLDKMNLTESASDAAVATFSRLARGHALVTAQETVDEVWEQARPGNLVLGDQVRVKTDAYSGTIGQVNNGRRGRIVGIRYGNIYVKYTDEGYGTDSIHHKPSALEKRVR
jgi:hypothetical protein